MKVRAIGNFLLFFGGFCLVWSGSSRQLRAGQDYPRHVTVFGQSSAASGASQKIDPPTEADIRQLMDIMETKATATEMLNSMVNDMRPLLLHSLPAGQYRERLVQLFYEKFRAKTDVQKLLDLAVPVYAQYLSDDDIKGLIQFYKTPLGQKWLEVRPELMAKLAPQARSWGQQMGREAMREVLEEHPDLAQQLKAAAEATHQH